MGTHPIFESDFDCLTELNFENERPCGHKIQKVMVQPINLLFRFFQKKLRVQIWLYDVVNARLEGIVIGFDEYMNLVLDEAEEINVKTHSKRQIGKILLKGDNITLIQQAPA